MTRQTIDWSGVAAAIAAAEATGGTLGVSVIAPNGEHFRHRGEQRFLAASTMKIPVMVAVYQAVDAGVCSLNDRYALRADDKIGGSGVLAHLHDGLELTVEDLIYLMIAISDNTATNALIDLVGIEQVRDVMRQFGMTDSVLARKLIGRASTPGDPDNWAVPDEYARLMQAILDERAASPVSCARMVAMLATQQNAGRIARYLPAAETIRWGSKNGTLPGIAHDVGFITTPRGTLILSVYTQDLADLYVAEQVIGEISAAALQATGLL